MSAAQQMQAKVGQFFTRRKIVEALPDNAKVVILNHELSLAQAIDAMIV